jgi:hypothetical protein
MTLEYLSQLNDTYRYIKQEENRIEMLRLRMGSINSRLTGMPGRSGVTDRIGDLMPDIVDKTRKLDQLKLEFEIQRSRLEVEIRQIERIRIRLIFLLRFVDLKTWGEVASAIGGDDTDNSCKQACYRYLRGIEE